MDRTTMVSCMGPMAQQTTTDIVDSFGDDGAYEWIGWTGTRVSNTDSFQVPRRPNVVSFVSKTVVETVWTRAATEWDVGTAVVRKAAHYPRV